MTTEEPSQAERIAKRKAWTFASEGRPSFVDALSGREGFRAFWRYWVTDNLWNLAHLSGHFGMKLLPMDACSNLGAALGLFAVPRFHKVASRRAQETIRALRPDLNEAEQAALFRENCRAQGRLMTEFSVVNRLQNNRDRLTLHGLDIIGEAAKAGPVIIVGMHLGNWEVGPTVLQSINVHPHAFYLPPKGRAKAWIAERVRSKAGLRFLPPGAEGIRPAIKILKKWRRRQHVLRRRFWRLHSRTILRPQAASRRKLCHCHSSGTHDRRHHLPVVQSAHRGFPLRMPRAGAYPAPARRAPRGTPA